MEIALYINGEKMCQREIAFEKSILRQRALIEFEKTHLKFICHDRLMDCDRYEIFIIHQSKLNDIN